MILGIKRLVQRGTVGDPARDAGQIIVPPHLIGRTVTIIWDPEDEPEKETGAKS